MIGAACLTLERGIVGKEGCQRLFSTRTFAPDVLAIDGQYRDTQPLQFLLLGLAVSLLERCSIGSVADDAAAIVLLAHLCEGITIL
jgi:hypothetical protein